MPKEGEGGLGLFELLIHTFSKGAKCGAGPEL